MSISEESSDALSEHEHMETDTDGNTDGDGNDVGYGDVGLDEVLDGVNYGGGGAESDDDVITINGLDDILKMDLRNINVDDVG